MLNTSLAPWPSFSEEEAEAVTSVLRSNRVNYWTGQEGRQFEREFAAWSRTDYAIALANGTLALDLALQGLGIGSAYGGKPTDEVVVTPRTFIASISCVVNAGARPVFADVNSNSGLITSETIESVLTENTRAIIPVHLAGWPCDMDAIMRLAKDRNLKVIEDCAQAHGASFRGQPVGSMGDVGAWSFCQDKIITTGGEGGMVTCNDEALWSRMWSFKDHGKSWDAVYNRQHQPGFRWLHESIGTNWRMLEIQAVIGRIQLRRMEEWHNRRTEIANAIARVLVEFPGGIRVPLPEPEHTHAFYRLYAYVEPTKLKSGWSRDRIVEACVAAGAPVYQGSCSEVYLEKAFEGTLWRPEERLPVAKGLGETSLMFLTHPTITDEQLSLYCETIQAVLEEATA
ncbi:DegT/DnrJ/EryC1/StrS aminotransferase family protein [Sphingorhabdus pulchriflava]|uniref:DegT/DnrJ/EryC1/StrS aminotransferase family protein n=1 Tax=Sphingorhabdus pulchriflava TaxID=2292257 RepID=A0A371B1S9_9SPHN|nr:DegT/DnrJ/EryC1/StrS aminotransferase family protein [Sphingorhabdus pulchriflava]RDV01464.1 DegT/DnrJ/EryC1/StrS aminotransferase family protein [Sphingorhabdus pulchriflava]